MIICGGLHEIRGHPRRLGRTIGERIGSTCPDIPMIVAEQLDQGLHSAGRHPQSLSGHRRRGVGAMGVVGCLCHGTILGSHRVLSQSIGERRYTSFSGIGQGISSIQSHRFVGIVQGSLQRL